MTIYLGVARKTPDEIKDQLAEANERHKNGA